MELTLLMPCLNEARTLDACIGRARAYISSAGIEAEILVADNGSTDGSRELAAAAGARVVRVEERGYGAALITGIREARGRFILMGDSDGSYDFGSVDPFLNTLRSGAQLVMGNRFAGGIAKGAMPPLHRYLGNPVLSFLGRLFFKVPVRDFHCGLRGFEREAILSLGLSCKGMEFASEMVVKAALAGLRIAEVPTTLSPDGRDRAPHLRTWRDGWRHLRFLLLFSPRWLFLYPGLVLFLAALAQLMASAIVPSSMTSWPVGIHAMLFAAAALVLGYQTVLFSLGAVLARDLAGLASPFRRDEWAREVTGGPWLPLGGGLMTSLGLYLCAALTLDWGRSGFGTLNPEAAMRQVIPGVALLILGTQSLLASIFFAAMRSAFESGRGPTDGQLPTG